MSRKTFYLPTHIKDRLLKFRNRNGTMDEQSAIIRLIDAGLTSEETKYQQQKYHEEFKVAMEKILEDQAKRGRDMFGDI